SPAGDIVLRGPLFEEAVLTYDVDFEEITRARAEAPLLADLEVNLPHLIKSLGSGERRAGSRARKRATVKFDPATNGTAPRSPLPAPKIHVVGRGVEEGDPLQIDADLARRWLVSFLKDEVVRRRGFTKGIVGLSGGVDSSLTAFLAVEALGKENVIGVRMPYRTSSPESLDHALLVIQTLGIQAVTIDITAAVDGYLAQVGRNGDVDPTRRGNVMARERMIVLFDLSAKYKALPIGTSNKSERLLGYFTWHADDTPPVNPLGDLFKTQVRALARHVGVPEVILRKPPTPDLVRADGAAARERPGERVRGLGAGARGAGGRRGRDPRRLEAVRHRIGGQGGLQGADPRGRALDRVRARQLRRPLVDGSGRQDHRRERAHGREAAHQLVLRDLRRARRAGRAHPGAADRARDAR